MRALGSIMNKSEATLRLQLAAIQFVNELGQKDLSADVYKDFQMGILLLEIETLRKIRPEQEKENDRVK